MIFDRQSLFSEAQAITVDAASTNVIDLGPIKNSRKIGHGDKIPLAIQVVEAFATLTSLEIKVQECAVEGFGSGVVDLATTGAIPVASLVAGYRASLDVIPRNQALRYIRLYYDVTGTAASAGKITAGIVGGDNSHG
jgi:hypothetical protein